MLSLSQYYYLQDKIARERESQLFPIQSCKPRHELSAAFCSASSLFGFSVANTKRTSSFSVPSQFLQQACFQRSLLLPIPTQMPLWSKPSPPLLISLAVP